MKETAEYQVKGVVIAKYDTQGAPQVTTYVDEKGDNLYTVTGKVTIKDKHGDSYFANYSVTVKYDPENNEAKVKDYDIDTPTKNS